MNSYLDAFGTRRACTYAQATPLGVMYAHTRLPLGPSRKLAAASAIRVPLCIHERSGSRGSPRARPHTCLAQLVRHLLAGDSSGLNAGQITTYCSRRCSAIHDVLRFERRHLTMHGGGDSAGGSSEQQDVIFGGQLHEYFGHGRNLVHTRIGGLLVQCLADEHYDSRAWRWRLPIDLWGYKHGGNRNSDG